LEVLIAIVVFSIGLLGIAGLQVAGMRYTHASQLRTIATMQTENMVDRMRANMRAVEDGDYNITGSMPSGDPPVDCDNADCTPAQLATYDLIRWNVTPSSSTLPREANADVLPGGTGIVCIDSTPSDGNSTGWACDNLGTVFAIKVQWTEQTVGADDTGDDVANTTRNQILVMRVIP
jgi:type IV pilus assembly protein PilV